MRADMARPGSDEFARLTDPFRGELLAYCYRMLGSVHDAEDQLQETLTRAWRSYGEFEGRSSLRTWLALIAAMQYLPARQRAVLILRDVLGWRSAEVAGLLGTSTVAVNSALLRARAHLAQAAPAEEQISEPDDPAVQALLGQYAAAFENADVTGLIRLLRDDAIFEMPPMATWYAGREPVGRFLAAQVMRRPGKFRMVPVAANGQPAFAAYLRGNDGAYRAHAVQVLTVTPSGVSRLVSFNDPGLFAAFGLPAVAA